MNMTIHPGSFQGKYAMKIIHVYKKNGLFSRKEKLFVSFMQVCCQ